MINSGISFDILKIWRKFLIGWCRNFQFFIARSYTLLLTARGNSKSKEVFPMSNLLISLDNWDRERNANEDLWGLPEIYYFFDLFTPEGLGSYKNKEVFPMINFGWICSNRALVPCRTRVASENPGNFHPFLDFVLVKVVMSLVTFTHKCGDGLIGANKKLSGHGSARGMQI